jgi:ATP-binding cassette subfamily B protein/subfamily B ATP-binding cassette protein MsbA
VLVDGVDVRQLDAAKLRRGIGYVMQGTGLLPHLDVRANVGLLLRHLRWPGPRTQARVEELLELVGLPASTHGARLPHELSGGERQRIAIARAFLKNAPILLLDEATSAVDTKSEHFIQQAINQLRQNRTCLVIAHRLSTIVAADQIYVMRLGRVLAHGKHHELVQSCPYYAELAALAFDEPDVK